MCKKSVFLQRNLPKLKAHAVLLVFPLWKAARVFPMPISPSEMEECALAHNVDFPPCCANRHGVMVHAILCLPA